MTTTARNNCAGAVLPPLLLILVSAQLVTMVSQPILLHTIVTEAHYMLFSRKKKK